LVLLLVACASLNAQVYTGTIAGRITDQTGAVLPGVSVTLTANVLIRPELAVSSSTGAYRFAELPIGTYSLTFELPGFQTLVREGIILTAGSTQTINAQLGIAEIQETITVSGESPVVDVRQTGIPEAFENERLENIPTARDPWVILEQTPGMAMNKQNVGGNESGQQSGFYTRGTSSSQNTWNYDGVNITDNAATGSSPMYFDFGAFEEINITTGGASPRMQTAGTGINFVIKQGTNQWRGQAQFYGNHNSLQSNNITPELQAQGAGAGAPIKYILDYGFDIGGPIIGDRAWIWGDYGVQDIHKGTVGFLKPGCDDADDVNCLMDDPTMLRSANAKFNLQITPNNKFNLLWTYTNKTRETRGASDTRPFETTWQQRGLRGTIPATTILKFEDTHIFSDNFLLTGRFAYFDGGFGVFRQDESLRQVQVSYDFDTGQWGRSFSEYEIIRPNYIANFDGNYFLTNALGGDHELKFGYQYKKTPVESFTTYGGDVRAYFESGVAVEARMYREGERIYEGTYHSLHFQDIITMGRVTVKLGLRYDHQTGKNGPATLNANMVAPDLLPAVDVPGTPPVEPWQNVSPRLGLTYDITNDGKSIFRASYSRFYDLFNLAPHVSWMNAGNPAYIQYPWTDLNGDTFVQRDEIDDSRPLYSRDIDPNNPDSLTSPNARDPDTSAPTTDEFIIGFEREVVPEFSLGVNYIYKYFGNMLWADMMQGMSSGSGTWIPSPTVPVTTDSFVQTSANFEGQEMIYYELKPGLRKVGDLTMNRPGYHRRYWGLEFVGRKRLSNRWMMNVSFTFNDHREYWDGEEGIYDPTNIDKRNGGFVFFSGANFVNARWLFKLDGMVQLPYGINLAGKFNGRQGYFWTQTYRTANRAGGIGRTEVMLQDALGENRLPNLWYADLRLEKSFNVGRTRWSGMMDIFNLTNAATVLGKHRRQNLSNANQIWSILSARILRFGLRVYF
jgi:hypothetical protein